MPVHKKQQILQRTLHLIIVATAILFAVFLLQSNNRVSAQEGREARQIRHDKIKELLARGVAFPGECNVGFEDPDEAIKNCSDYCKNPDNFDACKNFTDEHTLLAKKDVKVIEERRRKVIALSTKHDSRPAGPSKEACDQAFENSDHSNPAVVETRLACLDFACEQGVLPAHECEQQRNRILHKAETKDRIGNPPVCGANDSREVCETKCRANEKTGFVCCKWAAEHELIDENKCEEIKDQFHEFEVRRKHFKERAQKLRLRTEGFEDKFQPDFTPAERELSINGEKALAAIEQFGGPLGCSTFQECSNTCNNPDNAEACFAYAKEHDLINIDDIKHFEKLISAKGPNGCVGQDCKIICDSAHENGDRELMNACLDFACEQDILPSAECKQAKKYLDAFDDIVDHGGPGDCRDERSCSDYCSNPEHFDECVEFGKKHDIFSEKRRHNIEQFKEFREEIRKEFSDDLPSDITLPGECTTKDCVFTFCADPAHRNECAEIFGKEHELPEPGKIFQQSGPERHFREDGTREFHNDSSDFRKRIGIDGSSERTVGELLNCPQRGDVCGTNFQTYANRCYAEEAKVEILHKGVCTAAERQQKENIDLKKHKDMLRQEEFKREEFLRRQEENLRLQREGRSYEPLRTTPSDELPTVPEGFDPSLFQSPPPQEPTSFLQTTFRLILGALFGVWNL